MICEAPLETSTTAKTVPFGFAATRAMVPLPAAIGPVRTLPLESTMARFPLVSLAATRTFVWSPVRAMGPRPLGIADRRLVGDVAAGFQDARIDCVAEVCRMRIKQLPDASARISSGRS